MYLGMASKLGIKGKRTVKGYPVM
jgi:hypothetical protein